MKLFGLQSDYRRVTLSIYVKVSNNSGFQNKKEEWSGSRPSFDLRT